MTFGKNMTRYRLLTTICFGLFCLLTLGVQIYFTFVHSPRFEPDPLIGHFASSYRWTSLLSTSALVIAGMVVCFWGIVDKRSSSQIALFCFAGYIIYSHYLSDIGFYFHGPLGDGSLAGATSAWIRLNGTAYHIFSIVLLGATLVLTTLSITFCRQKRN